MKFRTEIKCLRADHSIDHQSKLFLIGSCFSENMERKFEYFKFNQLTNPFGILFHPLAIEKAIDDCLNKKEYLEDDLLNHRDIWLSLHHHSKFNNRNSKLILKDINQHILLGNDALTSASHVIISLGTSWVYRWNQDKSTVANCHKIPQKHFSKVLLSSEEINRSLKQMVNKIQGQNPRAQFILTISPVRHLKDGFTENTLSKALLHKAVHEISKDQNIHYFPSYEIMMDDLRDYRFYKSDMIHPNDTGVDYIWEKFASAWMNERTREVMKEIEGIQRSLLHRPFDPESEEHKKFLSHLEEKIKGLSLQNPEIEFHKKRK